MEEREEWILWEKTLISQNGSLYVSVPKTWCLLNNLKKGDKIKVRLLRDGSLKIFNSQRISKAQEERE